MDKHLVEWRTVSNICGSIVERLKDSYPDILDYSIIGLSRGGLVPSVIMSNMLNVRKVYSIGVMSYDGQDKKKLQIYQIPALESLQKILLVDDISDSGDSFNEIRDMLPDKEIRTVSLFVKDKTNHIPDVYGNRVARDTWVVFPWE